MDANDSPEWVRSNIGEKVYRTLRERFLSREFKPGQRLHLPEMEKQMEISRTPLKDALNRLAAEGLIKIKPRSGTFVAPLDPVEIAESFEVRRALELCAVELLIPLLPAPQFRQIRDLMQQMDAILESGEDPENYRRYISLDREMHQLIVQSAGNKRLAMAWDQVNVHVQMARVNYEGALAEFQRSQREHHEIVQALEARDIDAARQALDKHIKLAKATLLDMIQKENVAVTL